jgi:hypothetical protein
MSTTHNETADFLLRQIRFLKRVGSATQKQEAPEWERLIIQAAAKAQQPQAVTFAAAQKLEA